MKTIYALVGALAVAACSTTPTFQASQAGLVEYHGRQSDIVAESTTAGTVPIAAMSGANGAYGVGAYEGLDGEITIFEGKPFVTQVRRDGFTMDNSQNGKAIFAAWTKNKQWRDEPVPADVKTYLDLQRFVKARATAAGIDTATTPFPFLLSGAPAELQWHINVDRTEGKPVNAELFKKSKANYVMKSQPVDIVGFYSEKHFGAFIGTYVPAIMQKDVKNNIHIHLVSKDGKSAGHIDNIALAGGITLRLPKQ
jgi:acetolactate decarboxylase